MKIIVAVDSNPYSGHVAHEVGKLAVNTWADITIIGVLSPTEDTTVARETLKEQLVKYRRIILDSYTSDSCPYNRDAVEQWEQTEDGYSTARTGGGLKQLQLLIAKGSAAQEILLYNQRSESDLIVISCDKDLGCSWQSGKVPMKVATEASCSVLVVKETKEPEQVVCCLDHDHVTQYSLEMINQLVTLYGAELKIVGISDSDSLKENIEQKMQQLLEYYNNIKLTPWLEVVDGATMPSFISMESQKNLVALWVGPTSFLNRFFPKKRISSFISDSPSSVLLLR